MSLSRLLRAERLVKESAARDVEPRNDEYTEAVRLANEGRVVVYDPLPPPEAPPEPAPDVPPPAEAKAEPPPPQPPRQWWEEHCRWRERTAADDYDESNTVDEDDDPLGIYS